MDALRLRVRPRRAPHARDAARVAASAAGACSGAGSPGSALAAAGLLLRGAGRSPRSTTATSRSITPAAAVRGRRHRRRAAACCAATCSCWRCTRWPASPASSPAARCRCRPSSHSGLSRWVHEHGGRIAIAFVVGATTFSLSAQAYVIGHTLAGVSHFLRVSPGAAAARRAAARDPRADRAVPAARRLDHRQPPREWEQLLAATVVTVAIAVPVLVLAAFIEVYVSPHLFTALTHIHPPIVRAHEGWIVTVTERLGARLLAASRASASALRSRSRLGMPAIAQERSVSARSRSRSPMTSRPLPGTPSGHHVLHFV